MSLKKRLESIRQEHTCAVCGRVCDDLPGSCVVNGCHVCPRCWKDARVWTEQGEKICQRCEAEFDEAFGKDA